MATTIGTLLGQHPANHVTNTEYTTSTNKEWAKAFYPITKTRVHCKAINGAIHADFDTVMLSQQADDTQRMQVAAYPPNRRIWKFSTETDIANWFHHEVSNIVMAAWADQPKLLQQAEVEPLSETEKVKETVDLMYSMRESGGSRVPVVIGEMKRNSINLDRWMTGNLGTHGKQGPLSRELRGYAYKYECPQIFCFDGQTLLLLQFRASNRDMIASPDCEIDSWVIPVSNERSGSCTLRYALYRFLVHGLRRCQGNSFTNKYLTINGHQPKEREYFSGDPLWELPGTIGLTKNPWGCYRAVDTQASAMYWMREGQPLRDNNEDIIYDTRPILTV